MIKHAATFIFIFLVIKAIDGYTQIRPVDPNNKQTQIRAVIIGISRYSDSLNFENLRYADKDADAYADFLTSINGAAVPKKNVRLLRNEEATRSNIIEAMSEIYGPAQSEDILIFFFSGHGESTGPSNVGMLCPSDIQKKVVNSTGFRMNELDEMFDSKAKIKMTLIDACHAGLMRKAGPRQMDRIKSGQQVQKNSEINTSLQKYLNNAPEGNLSILSCQGVQESKEFDHLKHGVFTYYLLRGLQGEADKFLKGSPEDGDGEITVRELYGYILEGVTRTTNNHQVPLLHKSLPDGTVIANCKPNRGQPKAIEIQSLLSFNQIDTLYAHQQAARYLDEEKPAINFECPAKNESGVQILEFTFTNPTIFKDVAFIYVEIRQYISKSKTSEYYDLYHQVYKPQPGLNRIAIENRMSQKNMEVQVGYALNIKPGDEAYHYYHMSCYSSY